MPKREPTDRPSGPAARHTRGPRLQRCLELVVACAALVTLSSCGDSDSPTRQAVAATVSVSPPELTLEAGKTSSLQAAVAGADGATITGARVAWSTTSPAIATITQSGVVSGVASGVVRVTAAAGSVSGSGVVAVTPAPLSQPVGTGGGTVSTPGGEVRVTLPNGTLPAGGSVTITPVTAGTTTGTTVPGTVYKIGVFGISTGPRPTITVRYSVDGLPPGFDERRLTLSRKIGVFWVPLPSVVDVTAKTITATLPSASVATAARPSASASLAADEDFTVGAALFAFEPSAASIQLTVGERRRITGRVVALASGAAQAISAPSATSSAPEVAAPAAAPTVTGTDVGVEILGVAPGNAIITLGASVPASGGSAPFAADVAVTVVRQASLAVTISGLPAGANAAVTVSGPGGFTQTLTASQTIAAAVGTYTISAQSVSSGGQTYTPSPATQSVIINAGDSKTATVSYAPTTGSLAVTISGLPNGAAGAVNVTGPGGFARGLTSTTTVAGLTAGQYTVSASPVTAAGGQYTPTPSTQSVGVSVGQTATAAVAYSAACATVTVQPSPVNLSVGATVQLVLTLKDASGNTLTGRPLTFTSSNAGVASVSTTGLVTGNSVGTTTLSVKCDAVTTQIAAIVSPPPVASVTVAPPTFAAFVGDTIPLSATTRDATGNVLTERAITWTSNTTTATVSAGGRVAGLTPGNVTITATSEGRTGTSTGVFGCFVNGQQVACGTLNIGIQTPPSPITGTRTVVNGLGHLRCLFSIAFVPTGGDAGTWVNDTPNWTWATTAIRSGANLPATVDYFQDWTINGQPAYPPFQITITWRYRINSSGALRSVTMGPLTCQ